MIHHCDIASRSEAAGAGAFLRRQREKSSPGPGKERYIFQENLCEFEHNLQKPPAKSETEALSYLIRGEGLDPSGDSDNTMITSALINLGLSQGSHVFESLGDAVGISGLGFETEGVGDSSQLVVSGYVLPGLKVKYGVGIFDSLATLTLRYRVIPRLYVEAVSGVDQALDLLYSFEF